VDGPAYFYYYVNYMYKFWELFDTVLLALRGRPTPFLHTYHHAATLVLCWSQLRAKSCMQWLVIEINLAVHIFMYMYYTLHALKIDVWWKRYLTMGQIVQFVVALVGCWGALLPRLLNSAGFKYFPHCYGDYTGAFFGVGILTSYLYLFIKLYRESYPKDKKGGGGKSSSGANSRGTTDYGNSHATNNNNTRAPRPKA